MSTAPKYKPGDRVVSTANWHRQKAGSIARPGRGISSLVRWDGEEKDERVYHDGMRPETPEDVAKRAREAALRAWRDQRPDTKIARVEHDHRWGHNDEIGAGVHATMKTPADMRQAADELIKLADWFEQKPSRPSATTTTAPHGSPPSAR